MHHDQLERHGVEQQVYRLRARVAGRSVEEHRRHQRARWAADTKRARWAEGTHWSQIIGVSPKATRDWAATCLWSMDINESVIGRLFKTYPKD